MSESAVSESAALESATMAINPQENRQPPPVKAERRFRDEKPLTPVTVQAKQADDAPAEPTHTAIPQSVTPSPLPLSASEPASVSASEPASEPAIARGSTAFKRVSARPRPCYTSPLGRYFGMGGSASTDAERSRYFRSTSRHRLAKMPEMFGVSRRFSAIASIDEGSGITTGDLPHAGGISGLKVAENNQAMTSDRIWFGYSHMHDAFSAVDESTGTASELSADRYVFGIERTFSDGAWSAELRLPISGDRSSGTFQMDPLGDVSFILKRLLHGDACRARSIGLGIELPTGDSGRLIGHDIDGILQSDSVHLIPFFAASGRNGDRMFRHFFAQLDIPIGSDDISVEIRNGGVFADELSAPLTASIDAGLGYWLLVPDDHCDSGLAAILEAQYTTRLGSADQVTLGTQTGFPSRVNFGGVTEDVLNITTGVHAECLGGWATRVAASIPVTDDQIFDSQWILQVNRTF
ncbi:MAG: hypothetical protein HKN47_18445 [Pirellulaceae bacterium]|nr:hypothetical protein [Pirellulaceae bacterium]